MCPLGGQGPAQSTIQVVLCAGYTSATTSTTITTNVAKLLPNTIVLPDVEYTE